MGTRRRRIPVVAWLVVAAGCAGMQRASHVTLPQDPATCVTLRSLMRESLDPCVKQLQPIAKRDMISGDDYERLGRLAQALEDGAYKIADHPPRDSGHPLEEYYWHGGILVARANELRWACARQNVEGVRLALSAVVQSCNACHEKFRKDTDGYASY